MTLVLHSPIWRENPLLRTAWISFSSYVSYINFYCFLTFFIYSIGFTLVVLLLILIEIYFERKIWILSTRLIFWILYIKFFISSFNLLSMLLIPFSDSVKIILAGKLAYESSLDFVWYYIFYMSIFRCINSVSDLQIQFQLSRTCYLKPTWFRKSQYIWI